MNRIVSCFNIFGLLLTGLLFIGAGGTAWAQDANHVCRVTPAGTTINNGADWAHPMKMVTALNQPNCWEIWVAQGLYYADSYPYSFFIRPALRVYGGFTGNETSNTQRDPVAHLTVLSGDRDHNDTSDANGIDQTVSAIKGTNSQNVVTMQSAPGNPITASTVLDGFTITGGNSLPVSGFGAGLYCVGSGNNSQCSPTLNRLVFVGNEAYIGGAMYLDGGNHGASSPAISNSVFRNNVATDPSSIAWGGAIYCNANTSGICTPTLTNVLFSNNQADGYGGAIFNDAEYAGNASPILNNVVFDGNSTGYQGGAVMNYGYGGISSPSMYDVTFSNNSAGSFGGALTNEGVKDGSGNMGTSNPVLSNVTFFNNSVNNFGGAIANVSFNTGSVNLTMMNVTLSGNRGGQTGGAIYSTGALGTGVGIINAKLTNVILYGNTATNGSNIYIDNSNNSTAKTNIDYSIVQNGDASIGFKVGTSTLYASGILNLNGNPLLSPLGNNGGFTPTMAPGPGGVAINTGTCTGAPLLDQRGVARPNGPGCDIGAVEAMPDAIFVNGFESH